MPLEAVTINDFNTPVMRETTQADELKHRLQDLYENDKEYHHFQTGREAIAYFQRAFADNHQLYVGIFNDKPICAIECRYQPNNLINLQQLAMHQENKNRGIEEQFIRQILQMNKNNSYSFVSNEQKIDEIIKKVKK